MRERWRDGDGSDDDEHGSVGPAKTIWRVGRCGLVTWVEGCKRAEKSG